MKIFIYPNLAKPNSKIYTDQACEIMLSENAFICMESEYESVFGKRDKINYKPLEECVARCDVIVVIGGDGTILRCSSVASRYGKPILGLNCGTLGFMASLEYSDIEKLRLLCRGEYTVTERMMLSVAIKSEDGGEVASQALNDAVLYKGEDCNIVDFEIVKSGNTVSTTRADGVIFSTATGATAYALSAGGPIIEPDMQCIEFSQICPHSLFARSVIFAPDSLITVHCRCRSNSQTVPHSVLTVDGRLLGKVSENDAVIIKRSELKTGIIDITGGSFFSTVNRKLMTPLK